MKIRNAMKLSTTSVRYMWLVVLAVLFPVASMAQPAPPVEVAVHTAVTEVRRSQTFAVTVVVKNVDAHRRVVLRGEPGFHEAGGIDLVAIDDNGKQLRLPSLRSEWTLNQVRSGDRRVLLEPRTSFGTQRHVRASDWFPKAGRYELVATYTSPLPTNDNRSVVGGQIEGSRATSQSVVIEVTE